MENFFSSRDLFVDVMSVHNRNMKQAHAIDLIRQIYKTMAVVRNFVIWWSASIDLKETYLIELR